MYLLIIFLPLISFCFILLGGRVLTKLQGSWLVCFNLGIVFFLSCFIFYEVVLCQEVTLVSVIDWLVFGYFRIEFCFVFDFLSVVMLLLISLVSVVVHVYSVAYLGGDPYLVRYMGYISVFTFFMFFLVVSDNIIQLFIGWEGVGLSSYLLISFWYTRTLANLAALKAMLVNRVGDIFLLIGAGMIYIFFGTGDFFILPLFLGVMFDLSINIWIFSLNVIDIICLFLFLGAMGKSAQLCFHIWLPDAMEGPTPVSALIHAATMVTAGVFLVLRCSFLFEESSNVLLFVVFIGAVTCFVMGVLGIFNNDIKKIVAYSTCSQLGYMILACGISNYFAGFFHLFNHAFFKALLFLSMGSVIHALVDEQDLKRMGGLGLFLPVTSLLIFVANLALLGIPFFSGYYSKDFILEIASYRFFIDGGFSYLLGLLAVFCTAFYSVRMFIRVFLGSFNGFLGYVKFIHESSIIMWGGMIILGVFSLISGYLFFELFLGIGNVMIGQVLFINVLNYSTFRLEFNVTSLEKLISLFFLILGVVGFVIMKDKTFFYNGFYLRFVRVFYGLLYFDVMFGGGLVKRFLNFSYYSYYKHIEFGFFVWFFFLVGRKFFVRSFKYMSGLTWGRFYLYIFFVILGLSFGFVNFIVLDELEFSVVFYMLAFIGVLSRPTVGWFWVSSDRFLYVYIDFEMWVLNLKIMGVV